MALSDLRIRKLRPADKPYKVADANGLYLYVTPTGSLIWRMDYRFEDKRKTITLGRYPTCSLANARALHLDAMTLVDSGIDPSSHRRQEKARAAQQAENTFDRIADEYIERLVAAKRAEATVEKNRWFKRQIDSAILNKPIIEVTSLDILENLQRIERTGRRDTAHGVRGFIGSVFRLAISTLRAEHDPTYALRNALLPKEVVSRAALTDPAEVGALMENIRAYDGWITLRYALEFIALTFARPVEVRKASWDEFDMEDAVWHIPAERTKARREHDVPLSTQAVVVINRARRITGRGPLVFPSMRSAHRPLSENAMNSALRRMGYRQDEMTAHGFRATASTILNERGYREDVIEAQLAHLEPNRIRRAYNRAQYWDERVAMMQAWADMLDSFQRSR